MRVGYLDKRIALLHEVQDTRAEQILAAASWIADAIRAGGLAP